MTLPQPLSSRSRLQLMAQSESRTLVVRRPKDTTGWAAFCGGRLMSCW
jgi:hypothetical protein